jgi:hypothetical protein
MTERPVLHLTARTEVRVASCPSCGAVLPPTLRKESWVEVPVGDGWVAAYRIVPKGGRPVVGEVRVFPAERRREVAGRWSERGPAVPDDGVPGRVLRELRLKDPHTRFPELLRSWEDQHGEAATHRVFRRFGFSRRARTVPRRPGRAGRPEDFYLAWAVAYADRIRAGSRSPIKDLARRPPVRIEGYVSRGGPTVAAGTVRDIVHRARTRGLLTESPVGRAGGELTAKAMRLLGPGRSGRARSKT